MTRSTAREIAIRLAYELGYTNESAQELLDRFHIATVPLYVIMDGVSYRDSVDITTEQIFAHVAAGGAPCPPSGTPARYAWQGRPLTDTRTSRTKRPSAFGMPASIAR